MKKTFLFGLLMATVFMAGMSSCSGCSDNAPAGGQDQVKNKFQTDYDGVIPDESEAAEHIIAVQRQTMFGLTGGKEYCWYETRFTFNDSLKSESLDALALMEITSTFQTFGPELCYTITTNAAKGTLIPAPVPGLWIEDFDLSGERIELGILDVLNRLQEWNGILPPAVSVVLRKPVGPKECNAQYVIGNPYDVIFVDAVTGDITDWNPAFPAI